MSLRDITLGTYVYGESVLHRLDPRTKLGCLLLYMTGMIAADGWQAYAAAVTVMAMACTLSGISPRYLARSLVPFRWLILVTFVLNALFTGGYILIEAPLPYGGITAEGLAAGTEFSLRLLLLVTGASLLTLTTRPVALVTGIEQLIMPFARFGVKPHEVALAMVITIRFIPVLIDEAEKIRKSFIARGFRPDRSLYMRLKGMSMLLIPLILSTVRRAEELAVAMECRGYRTAAARSRFLVLEVTATDWIALAATGTAALAMAVL